MSSQVFYPSVTVNFRLRFDESLQVEEEATIPQTQPQGGIVDQADPLSNLGAFAKATLSNLAAAATGKTVRRPLITQTGRDVFSYVLNRVPKTAQIELPSYRQAGKFTMEFDWRELPIDPRLLRAIGVEIYIGSVSPTDFSTGMVKLDPTTGRRRSVLATQGPDGSPKDDLLAMVGLVDNWAVTHGSDGSSIKMEGRDLRGIFLDSPINPIVLSKIDLTRSLVDVLADILRTHPAGQDLTILYNPDDWPTGAPPSPADRDGLTRVRLKADGDSTTGGTGGSDTVSFWDVITKYCFLVGAVPFFRGRRLIIRPAKSIFDQSKPSGQAPSGTQPGGVSSRPRHEQVTGSPVQQSFENWDMVFGGNGVRVDDDGHPFSVRKFIYGRNLKELSFERKFSGVKAPVVELVSIDTSSKERGAAKLVIASWPDIGQDFETFTGKNTLTGKKKGLKIEDEKASRTSVSPSGKIAQMEKIQISVPGVRDKERLQGMARALYEEIGRGELGGSAKTGFLSSFKGDNSDPDVTRLRPGHAVEFSMDTRQLSLKAPAANTTLAVERGSFEEAVDRIKGFLKTSDENLARAIVASSRSTVVDMLRTFRTSNVVFNWASDSLQTSFDFQNYLVVRSDIGSKLGANTSPPVETHVTRVAQGQSKKAPPTKDFNFDQGRALVIGGRGDRTALDNYKVKIGDVGLDNALGQVDRLSKQKGKLP